MVNTTLTRGEIDPLRLNPGIAQDAKGMGGLIWARVALKAWINVLPGAHVGPRPDTITD